MAEKIKDAERELFNAEPEFPGYFPDSVIVLKMNIIRLCRKTHPLHRFMMWFGFNSDVLHFKITTRFLLGSRII